MKGGKNLAAVFGFIIAVRISVDMISADVKYLVEP